MQNMCYVAFRRHAKDGLRANESFVDQQGSGAGSSLIVS